MNFLKKSMVLLAVCGVVPAAYALTARPSVTGTASSRLPTMTAYINSSSSSSSTSNLLNNADCIDAYTSCLKGSELCGPNFEECTTKVLFHGKMPQCLSTLAQCTSSGVNVLFGTSSITALSNVATKDSYDYIYPTDGSVLGQMIAGAAISNMYNTSDCVRLYTTCLQRENVCGSDFELCTTNTEFKKQMVYCDSTLARCQSEGKIELFGSETVTSSPLADSRVGIMISEGAALAAVNAVSTCYKVVDQCILNACAINPYKCYEEATVDTINLVDSIAKETEVGSSSLSMSGDSNSKSAIQSYIKNSCLNTIGSNKYCHATFLGNGQMPSASDLSDELKQEDVFSLAYSSRMNSAMKARILELIEDFDTEAKTNCANTIKSCAMRVCGDGSGAACYNQVFSATDKTINNSVSYEEIKTGCSDIVNTDAYCKYAAANPDGAGNYTYTYINNNAFDVLFPKYSKNSGDPIGVIAALNASLATSYSDAALAQMRIQCENVAKSCVRSMCGTDYTGCYRNRTDIYSSLTKSGETSYDQSMNKVGGVLDYTVVLGLCLDTVKTATACKDHLAVEQAKLNAQKTSLTASSWGASGNTRDAWIDAGAATKVIGQNGVPQTDADGNELCTASDGTRGICGTLNSSGKIYETPIYISYESYVQNEAATTLFSELIYDLEKEAQAIYNKKLTEEQNMCLSSNTGGIMSANDTGSTFMWVKLKRNKVPDEYSIMGLSRNDFNPSNDLYGSFCSVQVRLQSDNVDIQQEMKNADWATTYFAVGDTFTCGSWIPADTLEDLANAAAADATEAQRESQKRTAFWTTLLGSVGGAVGGGYLGAGIQDGSIFGKITGLQKSTNTDNKTMVEKYVTTIIDKIKSGSGEENDLTLVSGLMTSLKSEAQEAKVDSNVIKAADDSVTAWINAQREVNNAESSKKSEVRTQNNLSGKASNAESSLNLLKDAAVNTNSSSGSKNQWWGPTIGAVVTGVAGGLLINKATRDIQKSNLSAAEKAAYEEWMNNVGKHIKCYIGTEEAGEYGDILSVSVN